MRAICDKVRLLAVFENEFYAIIGRIIFNVCKIPMARFQPNQSSLYSFLFAKSFEAHDALEDVLALRKIIFESRLELSLRTIIENSGVVSATHAAKDVKYLDHRYL